ncbi:alpha-L-fucosidase [Pelagicoccus sp. SDUM812002]|uniref:alpha-L-fucosidase n=1 Tax=Pelagicoccus sp. SDUM812002 TaxID=3041266 RepID=UPI002810307F|nr:alpha-L-fucosidase [Pelagicoccus sp. SDUM812002]MDQ8188019.1 alpha-L-fucosidase [Pelagicoccus sp. SDUM812002]
MTKLSLILSLATLPVFAESSDGDGPYEANWESIGKHEAAPQWFRDAKLGIYFHWGVYSVPAYQSEWYPRLMHVPGTASYEHHQGVYGPPSEFGYHDFVPQFTAEKFDPEEWVNLFQEAGARFVGPVAEHHDGFAMWDSEITPWNAADKGPERDVTGELAVAAREAGLKFITTFHHARNLQRYADTAETEWAKLKENQWTGFFDSHYPLHSEYPNSKDESELNYLYGNIPEDQWLEEVWLGKVKEVVDKYQPDIVWFDSWLDSIPESYRERMAAYVLNRAAERDQEVVIVRKQDDLPLSFSVDDLEKSRKNELDPEPWMTDETLSNGSWCYTEGLTLKPAADVLHILVDIVSKNGVLLLNVSPKADGTIPEDQRQRLETLGGWLRQYGESVYGTRPWYTFGEGPTVQPEGSFENHQEFAKVKYSHLDTRYATKGNIIYATTLGRPENETITLEAFSEANLPEDISIDSVSLVASDESVTWTLEEDGLHLASVWEKTDDTAVVFKIVVAD